MTKIKSKTAFITGGTKGIGRGIAQALLKEGVNVAITGRDQTSLDEVVSELNKNSNSGKAIGIQARVSDFKEQQNAVEKILEEFGKIDFIIANAGIGHFASIDQLTIEEWNETIDTNLTGVFFTLKAGLDQLKENKGYFISIGSLAGTNFFKGGSAYNASKFGVTGFTQAAMLDMREFGIKSTVIMPGSVATHFNGNTPDEKDAWKIQKEDIGKLVVDLLKMESRALSSKVEIRPSFPPTK